MFGKWDDVFVFVDYHMHHLKFQIIISQLSFPKSGQTQTVLGGGGHIRKSVKIHSYLKSMLN